MPRGARKIKRTAEVVEKKFDGGGAKRKAINTYKDVAESDDDLEANQDKILLDGQARDIRASRDDVEASDEEVLALPVDESDDMSSVEGEEEGDNEEGWGKGKKAYYDADDASEEADLKAEEEEALRIQKRNLAKLSAADYIDDIGTWNDTKEDDTNTVEVLPTTIPEDLPIAELRKILEVRNPEFSPFASEFKRLHQQFEHLNLLAQRRHHPQSELINKKHDALRTYLAVLAFYFTLMSTGNTAGKIKEHEIMISLIRCREAWNRFDAVAIDESASDVVPLTVSDPVESIPKRQKRKRVKAIVAAPEVVSYAPEQDDELEETFRALKPAPKKKQKTKVVSDYADNVPDSMDAELSVNRRKTLQFHASRVHSKSSKKQQGIVSGDQDLPYRERKKDRDIRVQAQAEAQKGGDYGADLDDEAPEERKDEGGSEDEYYQLIASTAAAEKARRKKDNDDAMALMRAERSGYAVPEHLLEKRAIGRDISANKGVAVKKSKTLRNARVKKRLQYEKAKKKLGSKKAIFKQPSGSYAGESTGINTHVVKSVRLDQGQKVKR